MGSLRSFWRAFVVLPVAVCTTLAACRDDITAPLPGAPRATAVAYCAAEAPLWVAFQDGDGAWTRALPEVAAGTTTFRHEFSSDRAAVASVTSLFDGEFTLLRVLYGTPAELSVEGDTSSADCVEPSSKTLLGSVTGVDTTDLAQISLGAFNRSSVIPRLGGTDFSLDHVPTGPQDLLAVRSRLEADATISLRFILRRELDLPNGATIPALDFNSSEAFAPATPLVTIENGLPAVNTTQLRTPNGEFALPFDGNQVATATTRRYFAVPESKLQAGDIQLLHLSADGADRTVDVFYHSPSNRILHFGASPIAPTVSVIGTGAVLRLRAHFVPQEDYDRLTSIVYEQPTTPLFALLSMTPGYATRAGTNDIDIPDLLGVAGFNPVWGLSGSDKRLLWTATRQGGTLPAGRNVVPFDGAIRRTNVTQQATTLP